MNKHWFDPINVELIAMIPLVVTTIFIVLCLSILLHAALSYDAEADISLNT